MPSTVGIMLNVRITQRLRAEWCGKQYSNPHFQMQMLKLSGQALAESHTLLLAYRTPLAWSLERKMDNQLGANCGAAVAGVKPLWHYIWEYFPNFFPDRLRCLKTRRECFDFFFLVEKEGTFLEYFIVIGQS